MKKSEAQQSIKNLHAETFSLNPSAVITFFTFDLTDILFDKGLISSPDDTNINERVFRFHNNLFMTRERLIWQGLEYNGVPLETDGFEVSSQGALPSPKLKITVSDDGVPIFSLLKSQLRSLGDAAGVRVTRQRTLAKYLDATNFSSEDRPKDHSEDVNAEFPRDIFFIERVTQENKTTVEYQLNSILDLENVRLPARMMVQQRCMWFYRGEGCSYEYSGGMDAEQQVIHGSATLPSAAPPTSSLDNELFSDILPNIPLINSGKYDDTVVYEVGNFVFIQKDGIKYYFVCVNAPPSAGFNITNRSYWTADQCDKSVRGCKNRWQRSTPFLRDALPFGGFPGLGRLH
jgi:lambda family phage minor tail protein L